ncbi:hypothetical protein ACTRXD_04615 [Nitrospira sp. T9]
MKKELPLAVVDLSPSCGNFPSPLLNPVFIFVFNDFFRWEMRMRPLRVTIIHLVTKEPTDFLYARVMN